MTGPRYILAKLLTSLGLRGLDKYRTTAAFETHLIVDAERVVGELVWEQMDGIEDVSSEYWQLRKLNKEELEIGEKAEKLTAILDESQEVRARALEEVAEATRDKVEERNQAAEKTNRLTQEKENILREGRFIKRAYSGLRTKLEILQQEAAKDAPSAIETTRKELQQKRTQYEKFRKRGQAIDQRLLELKKQLKVLNSEIQEENRAIRDKAEQQFGTIGKSNKELTAVQSDLGVIQNEMTILFCKVGKFVIQHSNDPVIKKATRKQKALLTLIEEVRKSSWRHLKLMVH